MELYGLRGMHHHLLFDPVFSTLRSRLGIDLRDGKTIRSKPLPLYPEQTQQ